MITFLKPSLYDTLLASCSFLSTAKIQSKPLLVSLRVNRIFDYFSEIPCIRLLHRIANTGKNDYNGGGHRERAEIFGEDVTQLLKLERFVNFRGIASRNRRSKAELENIRLANTSAT